MMSNNNENDVTGKRDYVEYEDMFISAGSAGIASNYEDYYPSKKIKSTTTIPQPTNYYNQDDDIKKQKQQQPKNPPTNVNNNNMNNNNNTDYYKKPLPKVQSAGITGTPLSENQKRQISLFYLAEISNYTKQDVNNAMISKIDNDTGEIYGNIPDITVGMKYNNRQELNQCKLHTDMNSTICTNGNFSKPSPSVIIYDNQDQHEDRGSVVLFSVSFNTQHYDMNDPNPPPIQGTNVQALAQNSIYKIPIRVIRAKYDGPNSNNNNNPRSINPNCPSTGYRYDGLYFVGEYWFERQLGSFIFKFIRIYGQPELKIVHSNGEDSTPATMATRTNEEKEKHTDGAFFGMTGSNNNTNSNNASYQQQQINNNNINTNNNIQNNNNQYSNNMYSSGMSSTGTTLNTNSSMNSNNMSSMINDLKTYGLPQVPQLPTNYGYNYSNYNNTNSNNNNNNNNNRMPNNLPDVNIPTYVNNNQNTNNNNMNNNINNNSNYNYNNMYNNNNNLMNNNYNNNNINNNNNNGMMNNTMNNVNAMNLQQRPVPNMNNNNYMNNNNLNNNYNNFNNPMNNNYSYNNTVDNNFSNNNAPNRLSMNTPNAPLQNPFSNNNNNINTSSSSNNAASAIGSSSSSNVGSSSSTNNNNDRFMGINNNNMEFNQDRVKQMIMNLRQKNSSVNDRLNQYSQNISQISSKVTTAMKTSITTKGGRQLTSRNKTFTWNLDEDGNQIIPNTGDGNNNDLIIGGSGSVSGGSISSGGSSAHSGERQLSSLAHVIHSNIGNTKRKKDGKRPMNSGSTSVVGGFTFHEESLQFLSSASKSTTSSSNSGLPQVASVGSGSASGAGIPNQLNSNNNNEVNNNNNIPSQQ
ncbi:hypothetical protein ABK040_013169 [Willaertia magna]